MSTLSALARVRCIPTTPRLSQSKVAFYHGSARPSVTPRRPFPRIDIENWPESRFSDLRIPPRGPGPIVSPAPVSSSSFIKNGKAVTEKVLTKAEKKEARKEAKKEARKEAKKVAATGKNTALKSETPAKASSAYAPASKPTTTTTSIKTKATTATKATNAATAACNLASAPVSVSPDTSCSTTSSASASASASIYGPRRVFFSNQEWQQEVSRTANHMAMKRTAAAPLSSKSKIQSTSPSGSQSPSLLRTARDGVVTYRLTSPTAPFAPLRQPLPTAEASTPAAGFVSRSTLSDMSNASYRKAATAASKDMFTSSASSPSSSSTSKSSMAMTQDDTVRMWARMAFLGKRTASTPMNPTSVWNVSIAGSPSTSSATVTSRTVAAPSTSPAVNSTTKPVTMASRPAALTFNTSDRVLRQMSRLLSAPNRGPVVATFFAPKIGRTVSLIIGSNGEMTTGEHRGKDEIRQNTVSIVTVTDNNSKTK